MLADLKTVLKAILLDLLGPAYDVLMPLVGIVFPFLSPNYLWWVYLLSAVALAWITYRAAGTADRPSARGFLRFLVPREVYRHWSAWLDCKFYVVSSIVHRLLDLATLAAAVAGALHVADGIGLLLTTALGPAQPAEPSLAARAGYTLAIVAAADFAKWLAHYLQHKIPLLWEFHKVHHSAQVLTPLTNLRVHPVDVLLENLLTGLLLALVLGVYGYVYGDGIAAITVYGMAAIYFVAGFFAPLRHSHIPFSYGPWLSKVFCSPVMHQFHHSAETQHFDKNFSLVFSLWDYLAGTIYIPARNEAPRVLGIGQEGEQFRSVWALYALPFVAVARKLRARLLSPAAGV